MKNYIKKEKFKKVMELFQKVGDYSTVLGDNQLLHRDEKTIGYAVMQEDEIDTKYISVKEYKKMKKKYKKYKKYIKELVDHTSVDQNADEQDGDQIEEFMIILDEELRKDPTSTITIIDPDSKKILLQEAINGAYSVSVKTGIKKLEIITLGKNIKYNKMLINTHETSEVIIHSQLEYEYVEKEKERIREHLYNVSHELTVKDLQKFLREQDDNLIVQINDQSITKINLSFRVKN